MNEEKQKIIDKLAKVLTLAEDQKGTPEGESALRKASAMMAKHRIKESEVDLSTDSLAEDEIECAMDRGGWRQWVVQLSCALAGTFDCKSFFKHSRNSFSVNFIGTTSDVETCSFFQEIVLDHIERGAWEMWPSNRNWRKRNGFGQAAVSVIINRLIKMKAEMDCKEWQMGSTCTDLVIVKQDTVAAAYEAAYPKLKKTRGKAITISDRKTQLAGKRAGETAPLSRGLTDGTARMGIN